MFSRHLIANVDNLNGWSHFVTRLAPEGQAQLFCNRLDEVALQSIRDFKRWLVVDIGRWIISLLN